jgi:23S rRNA pseudouridine2605 synthase/23S rRNA pseudouridine2604 synthase
MAQSVKPKTNAADKQPGAIRINEADPETESKCRLRLQKFLSDAGVCSRRTGEALILQARVQVNRQVVTALGARIDPAYDIVEVDGQRVAPKQGKLYIALNKPAGYVTSCRHPGQRIVLELVPLAQRVFPVGRLDKDSTGLLLLTNDGPLHHRLSHPRFDHEKVYQVTVARPIADKALQLLARGMVLDDKPTRPAQVKRLAACCFQIVLREGRKRQIRRMVEAVNNHVVALKRIAFAGIALGRLATGTWRHLSRPEVERLQQLVRPGSVSRSGAPAAKQDLNRSNKRRKRVGD